MNSIKYQVNALPAIPTTIMMTGFLLKVGEPFPDDDPSMFSLFIVSVSSSFSSFFAFKNKPEMITKDSTIQNFRLNSQD